ncbi:E3 ubiquitin-protein ligase rnf213-alpha-like isoform X1 [Stylophora pistillata]|uniref:E3 ubiquitin-protein ligase rnf213-alpha-like isoform X1 n=1 Tax=Stylophora pistillata TaxID=50429 RepID=UPI000C03A36B|nr:E3 ubiquitin-protein ligase rnf213-alpha-like isoform X1 [Stylophora pistillata]
MMKCSNCGNTTLPPGFPFCPLCGSRLAPDQINSLKEKEIIPAVTSEHPKGDGTEGKHYTGESLQQNGTDTETNQNESSLSQQLGPMQVPNNHSANSPVQQEEAAAEESPGLSSESNQEETPATTDPDNRDLVKADEKGTGFMERSSAAITNTPEKAETGERQREDIASEQKVDKEVDKEGKGQEEEGSPTRNQSSIPPKQQQVTLDAGVTVVFHVLVSSVFEMTDRHLSIRASGVEFGDFSRSCVDLCAVDRPCKQKEKDYLQLFRGQLTLTPDQARKGTSYKYVVTNGGNLYWENLTEFLSRHRSYAVVTRALKIPNDHIQPGVTWSQFDGVAFFHDKNSYLKVIDKKDEYNTMALLYFLPKWKGFLVNDTAELMNATEALTRQDHVVECVSNVWLQEYPQPPRRKPTNLKVQKVFVDRLRPKLAANIAILTECEFGSKDYVPALVSSLAIIVVFKKYYIFLKREEGASLLRCLSFKANIQKELRSVGEVVLAEFSPELRKVAAKAIESLCEQFTKSTTAKNDLKWLLALLMSTPEQKSSTFTKNEDPSSRKREIQGDGQNQQRLPLYRDEQGNLLSKQTQRSIQPGQSYSVIVRGPAELDVDADQRGSYGGVNDTEKNVMQSKKSLDQDQVTPANQKQKGSEKEANKKADGAWTGNNHPFTPSGQSTSSENVTAGGTRNTQTQGKKYLKTMAKSGAEGKELVVRDPPKDSGNTRDGKEGAKGAANTLKQVEPEDGVTVIFHVVLASNLNMEEGHLHIQAEGEDLGNFKINCVDMKVVRGDKGKDKKKPTRFQGQFTLTIDRARKGTKYKYVIIKKKDVLWEELIEFQPSNGGVIVDRFLYVPDKYLKRGATWHQFDGVSYIYTEKGWWDTFKGWFRSEQTAQNRTTALLAYLPKWRGFVVSGCEKEMKATEAIVELDKVVNCLTNVWIQFSRCKPESRKPPDFNIDKVLMDHLEPKMKENAAISAQSDVQLEVRASALVSSVAIVLICQQYKIALRRELELSLLRCLSLAADPARQICTVYEAVLENFSEGLRERAAKGIEELCNRIMAEKRSEADVWLLALPLLHFLRGDSKPFEKLGIEGSHKKLDWFGGQGLKIKEFRRSAENLNLPALLSRLGSAFKIDLLLKRTFLFAIPVWDLNKIVASKLFQISDILVALVTHCSRERVPSDKWEGVFQCIRLMTIQFNSEIECTELKEVEFSVSLCLQLVEVFLKELNICDHVDMICHTIKLLFQCIRKQRRLFEEKLDQEKGQLDERKTIDRLLSSLRDRLSRDLYHTMSSSPKSEHLARELSLWSELLWVTDENQGFPAYRQFLIDSLLRRARRLEGTYLVEIFCEVDMDAYERAVGESFSNLACEAVEKITSSARRGDDIRIFNHLSNSKAGKSGQLLSMFLTNSWPKDGERSDTCGLDPLRVEFLLTWKPMIGYLKFTNNPKILGDESGRGGILSDECKETLFLAKSLLDALVRIISDGSVTFEVLLLLQRHKETFLELVKTSVAEIKDAKLSLAHRLEEIHKFFEVKENLGTFIGMCDVIQPVDSTNLKDKVPQDVSSFQIRDLCKRKDDNQIEVTFFKIPPALKEVLSALVRVQESLTFQALWKKYGNKAQTARKNDDTRKRQLSISDVVVNVWKPAITSWTQNVASVKDGTISLGDVEKLFDDYRNRRKELERELSCMLNVNTDQAISNARELKKTVGERLAQIQRYQQLHQYASAADTIWEFKEAMGFTGDFKVVEDLRNQLSVEFKQKPLNSVGESFSKAGQALQDLDVDKAQCFKAVVDSKRLVEWLRSTIKSTQELKVLVDLALISAGESDMETDRISSLHTSCLGFAPLIFDLKESEEQGVSFDQLMKACDPVWKAVETDQMLPKKLYDTSRHLEWLKTVKESHGSVAMTSLAQAKIINSSGVYVVGHLDNENCPLPEQGKRLSIKDVIQLTVPLKDGSEKEQRKTYSIDELKDLQSKLMLIAGKAEKGKDDVEQFVRNLEGVMRLANAYIDLFEAGYIHRMDWNQEFHCSKDQVAGESIAEELEEESSFMETCYMNWKNKVSDARKEYRELNYFTTQQLMILRKEIAKVCHSNDLAMSDIQVLTLLESVRPNLTSEQLKSAIERAFKDTDMLENARGTAPLPSFTHALSRCEMVTRKSVFDNNSDTSTSSSTAFSVCQVQTVSLKKPKPRETSKIQKFLNAAADDGYSEQIAVAALASLGDDAEEDDLLLWCLEEADEADIEALYEEAKQNPVIAREIFANELESVEQEMLAEDQGENESEPDMVPISSFLAETNIDEQEVSGDEDNEAEISQYLTLTQLGNILRELSVLGSEAVARNFPAFLKRGRPNLMLVPKDDILATVLALYMHDKKQPLPSHEEVLLCTPNTTTEEIELLWRRATGDVEGRFYCLVHADVLDFSVSKQAVEMLSVVTQGLAGKDGEHYGLVVICSSEYEDRAHVVAALDQYRVAAPPCPSPEDLKSYLKHQFQATPSQYGYIGSSRINWTTAGSLDPERLCVRVVSSHRGGLGKTLFVRRLTEQLPNLVNNDMVMTNLRRQDSKTFLHVTVPLHGNSTDSSMLVDALLPHAVKANVPLSRIFHLDVSPSMRRGLDTLIFNLLVLGYLCDKMGRVWRRRSTDMYVIEITTVAPLPMGFTREEEAQSQGRQAGKSTMSKRPFYDLLPNIECQTPRTVLCRLADTQDKKDCNPLFDVKEFRNAPFQRVYQYLKLSSEGKGLDKFTFSPADVDEDQRTCLVLLLRNCGIPDPSWSEIRHFVSFLNSQLRDCEQSFYCDMQLMRAILAGPNVLNLEGFRSFVVRFMIQMSRDFATPSLTEENTVFYTEDNAELERKEIEQFQLRRRWESSPHPYLFFNQDHITMTFLGFFINSAGDLVDPQTSKTLEKGLMSKPLRNGLQAQGVDFATNMETSRKEDKINQLCSVMGVNWLYDPDRAYELTTDNVKKILAIHMRFRCNIPVIVMGETGCGKTRLIRYMCGLQAGPEGPRNMLLVKVHGGTTYEDIKHKVNQAEDMARANQDKNIDTVLFFDEANTTEALTMIKEVMVDRRINGRPIGQGLERLQFIAACNPYRRHTDEMIHKLESAGLGYHVKADESEDRLGHIPLRHLVYRVHALPGSMRPLIWDFGQLKPDVEILYTNQIVSRYILHESQLAGDSSTVKAVAEVLAASQKYMRDQSDECSFVSLRDVERAMQVMVWFYKHVDALARLMRKVTAEQRTEEDFDVDEDYEEEEDKITPLTRALVLAIGVCYHAKLQERREQYRIVVARSFKAPCLLPGGHKQILREISSCQKAVLNELELGPNIARNTALSENVFMMVVCIELRIPLFVVGKPGSSKSLAKTVVADNMQGDAARSPLFKTFKQVHMASYQCSPLSTPEGIVATFKQCSKLQEGKNPDKFVSVVVLDEVGLAEDSPLMPLKTLHPLLEDGVTSADDVIETDEKPQRVAFIGISNWALDPAKMNRGIMLSRGVPSKGELIDSAMGICSTDEVVKALISSLISPLAAGYAQLYKEQKNFTTLKNCGKEEFFGLRDFYSLIKMVYAIAAKSQQRPRWHELEHAIKRNFGGLIEGDPVEIFKRFYTEKDDEYVVETSTTIRLIEASLGREDVADRANFSENRYLLILTENYAALPIMQQHLLRAADDAVVIFGSSFPNDQEYTQICRNINRIKVCMETGRTVILLNLESLYESLYDALNQYYVYFGGQKYVDLGLGTHRVKCRVDDGFKLIVIAEKDVVYNNFPIPLINRLEKHFLVTLTSLTSDQKDLVQKMRTWVAEFAEVSGEGRCGRDFSIGDAFVGFHEDTIPSIVMQVCNDIEGEDHSAASDDTEDTWEMNVLRRSQVMLLEMATPDAIARLPHTALERRAPHIWNAYFKEQQHSSLAAFMSHVLNLEDGRLDEKRKEGLLIQITTHSRLLSNNDLGDVCIQTGFERSTLDFMTLQQFQTEQQFRDSVRTFFEHLGGECPGILLVQCDSGDENFNLIAGARHILLEERTNAAEMLNLSSLEAVHIVLIIQLPRIAGGCRNFVGFQGGKWMSAHIDELRPPGKYTPSIEQLIDRPISELFSEGLNKEDDVVQAATVAVKLLRSCVQAAACRVDSETESAERSTHRIELLLDLLPDDYQSQEDEESFATVVVQRTHHLLKERELTAANPQGWLQSEALSGTGVQEWGTFRKALLQRVFSVVVPILAEIIALADRDCNLDLVKNDNTWVSRLWLKILADRSISELSYNDMISPGTNSVRERVQVIGSGAGGHRFSSRFPFSFIIKQRVEKLLKDASSVTAHSGATLMDSLRELIGNSQLGPPLDELRGVNSAGHQYLMDFVHMIYKPSNDVEHKLVYEAILSSARELGALEDEDGNESIDIALVHVAHSRIQHRLKCFEALVKAYPDLVQRLRETLEGNEAEVLLDVVALNICLEALEPSREMLLSPDTRRTWCDRVLCIRPAVEDMLRKERFGRVTENCSNYGERSTVMLGYCRSMWQRTGAVRLFVEHVTLFAEKDEDVNSANVLRLWKVLGDETDFSSLRSLQAIEKFLIDYSEDVKRRTNEETASELRRRCNAFFMELVSIFCFGDSVSKDLEQEAITLLMRYVIGHQSTQTKDFSPFPDYAIDPTPVVRSFLLQQLLRTSAKLTKLVKEHLGVFLQGARNLKPEPSHVKEVCFLCVQCMEDLLISRYQAKVADSKLTVKLKHAKKTCEESFTALSARDEDSAEMSALSLDGVAKGRYVLSLVVEFLYKLFIEGDSSYKDLDAKREVLSLLECARKLCMGMSSSTPQLYLLKQLVRRYGLDCVRTLGEYEELAWILPAEARHQEEDVIQDRFLVHGDHYRAVREGLTKTVISGKIQDTVSAITETGLQGVNKNVLLLLVMYREITMANVSPVQTQTLTQEVRVKLDDFVRNGGHLSESAQPFARELLGNSQGGQFQKLQVYNGKTPQEHTLAEIVIHTAVALQCVGTGSLAEPLFVLMTDPSTMNNSFLPTMPEDNFHECIKAIAETMKGYYKGEWYECGNRDCRYLYFIGECSKPMEKSTCPDCGRVIGGENHNFSGEHQISGREDRTKTGHALGEPSSRPTHAEPQRDMPPIVCSLLRIIMHSAMIMGASKNSQAIAPLITPPCPPQSEGNFLWQHLQRDLDVLGRALGRSVDDAALTVHLVLARMISRNGGQTANAHDMRLRTRESRRSWEKDFCSEILVPVITNLDEKLQSASKLLMGDERFGKDPLVRQLYEFDEHVEDLSQGVRPMSRSLWKYRQHITVEDLSSSFQREVFYGGKDEFKVLNAFLKQEHKLRFVQFLPEVVRLQRLLMDRFHRRIDRIDAERYTIREFLKDLPKGSVKEEYTNLFQSFKTAWNSCKLFLGDQGRLRVPQDLCNTTMDNDCPIAMVLPSTTGMGVCSTSLTFFLVNANNESLGAYRGATNQDGPLERVSVSEVTLSHLIAYDPERDLLPLILAHCNYSLEVGQETLVHYDWAALERQLIDRLLRGRPFVEFKEERFAFSRDTRDDAVFTSLTRKIPQESISRVIESQIIVELRSSLSDVCDVMSSLDIAIGFLASSGGQPERPLKSYLHDVLKLPKDRGLKSPTAEQHCSLSHTLALWRLMALERAKIKSRNKQEPFEQMPEVFKEKLSSSEQASLNRVLRKIDMDIFLPQLLQIILLDVKKYGETISTMSFEDCLGLCLANKDLDQIPGTENIPYSIKMAHLKAVWNSAVQLSDDFHKDRQAV